MQEIFHGREKPVIEDVVENKMEVKKEEGTPSAVDVPLQSQPTDKETTVAEITESLGLMKEEIKEQDEQIDVELRIGEDKNEKIIMDSTEVKPSDSDHMDLQEKDIDFLKLGSNPLEEFTKAINMNPPEGVESTETSAVKNHEYRKDLRAKLIRLARYPAVVPKPLCELKLKDEVLKGTIISKRGEQLKVKVDNITSFILIDDIEEVTVIN